MITYQDEFHHVLINGYSIPCRDVVGDSGQIKMFTVAMKNGYIIRCDRSRSSGKNKWYITTGWSQDKYDGDKNPANATWVSYTGNEETILDEFRRMNNVTYDEVVIIRSRYKKVS